MAFLFILQLALLIIARKYRLNKLDFNLLKPDLTSFSNHYQTHASPIHFPIPYYFLYL